MDRMAADCGTELKPSGVTMISLMPGAVRTEEIMAKIGSGEGLGGIPGMKERFLAGKLMRRRKEENKAGFTAELSRAIGQEQ